MPTSHPPLRQLLDAGEIAQARELALSALDFGIWLSIVREALPPLEQPDRFLEAFGALPAADREARGLAVALAEDAVTLYPEREVFLRRILAAVRGCLRGEVAWERLVDIEALIDDVAMDPALVGLPETAALLCAEAARTQPPDRGGLQAMRSNIQSYTLELRDAERLELAEAELIEAALRLWSGISMPVTHM